MNDVLHFDSMLTPKIITLVYWLLLLFAVGSGLVTIFGGHGPFRLGDILSGLGIAVGGAIAARIWCELLIVLFKIHENIKRLADKQA
jgi:hypothetical protein